MSKYEQLIEYIINDQEDKARELFHSIVVEKSREIYESLIDEEDLAEVGGNEVEELVDEISTDEEGMEEAYHSEEEDMDEAAEEDAEDMDEADDSEEDMDAEDEAGEVDMDAEVEVDDEMGGDEEPATKGDIMNIETALADLQSKFDELMADEMNEPEHADMGDDMAMPGDDMGADEGDEMAEMGMMPTMEAKKDKKEEMLKDKKDAKKDAKKDKKKMTESEWIREYVEKLGDIYSQEPAKGEGHEVGEGGTVAVDKQSIVAGKNDMGGTAKNLNQGDKGEDPDGKPTPKPHNEYTKGEGNLPGAGKFQNVPGANAGKSSYKSKAPAAKTAEVSNTNKKSPLAK